MVYGVEETYLKYTYTQFYRPSEVSDQFTYTDTNDDKPDIIRSLYVDAGKGIFMGISEYNF